MPSISKGPGLSRAPTTAVVAVAACVLLIVGLVFTPNIAPPVSGGEENLQVLLESPPAEPEPRPKENSISPLEEVLAELDQPSPALIALESAGAERVEWKDLRKEKVRKALRNAKKKAAAIDSALGPEWQPVKESLAAYITGIDRVLAGGGMPAQSAPGYLSQLDRQVTRVMAETEVPEVIRTQWADVSVGTELQSGFAALEKLELIEPFDPKLRLWKIRIRQGRKHKNRESENARVTVKLKGFVRGDLVDALYVYNNGVLVRQIDLAKNMDEYGRRRFTFRTSEDVRNAIFTFRAVDVKQRVYDRSYVFYPRVKVFHWDGRGSGFFDIPFPAHDPRLDRFFFVGAGISAGLVQTSGQAGISGRFEQWGLTPDF